MVWIQLYIYHVLKHDFFYKSKYVDKLCRKHSFSSFLKLE